MRTAGLRRELADLTPVGTRRMSANRIPMAACSCEICSSRITRTTSRGARPRTVTARSTRIMGAFLRDVMKLNMEARNFRLFSLDENNSNRWRDALDVTNRAWVAGLSGGMTTSPPTGG